MVDSRSARPLIVREAARAVLINREDRVLLFESVLNGRTFWVAPGGGLQEGETHEQAVVRELWEETGVQNATIGPRVWDRRHVFDIGEIRLDQRERYFLVRIDTHEVSTANFEEHEVTFHIAHRWWSLAEMAETTERLVPRDFARLLAPLLAGDVPTEPITVGLLSAVGLAAVGWLRRRGSSV